MRPAARSLSPSCTTQRGGFHSPRRGASTWVRMEVLTAIPPSFACSWRWEKPSPSALTTLRLGPCTALKQASCRPGGRSTLRLLYSAALLLFSWMLFSLRYILRGGTGAAPGTPGRLQTHRGSTGAAPGTPEQLQAHRSGVRDTGAASGQCQGHRGSTGDTGAAPGQRQGHRGTVGDTGAAPETPAAHSPQQRPRQGRPCASALPVPRLPGSAPPGTFPPSPLPGLPPSPRPHVRSLGDRRSHGDGGAA